ncbi:MAG: hypothetical protein RLZZ272_1702 [Actinomycetota bacterium]|jgi:hypothetical protein
MAGSAFPSVLEVGGASIEVRGAFTVVHDLTRERGLVLERPIRRVAALAVLANPFAGRYVADLTPLIDAGEELARLLGARAVAALDGAPVHSFGKGAIVGTDGELEHAAAVLHPKFGAPLREVCGGGKSLIPSSKKRGGPGATLDVPLNHKDAAFVRSHFDALEVRVVDAPAPDELVVAAVVTDGGRPLPRIGGLEVDDIVGEDGLR